MYTLVFTGSQAQVQVKVLQLTGTGDTPLGSATASDLAATRERSTSATRVAWLGCRVAPRLLSCPCRARPRAERRAQAQGQAPQGPAVSGTALFIYRIFSYVHTLAAALSTVHALALYVTFSVCLCVYHSSL